MALRQKPEMPRARARLTMIIELFGPPAAGKTTLAHALAAALERNGFDVQLIVSFRPGERGPAEIGSKPAASWCQTALAAPLSRAAKFVSVAPVLLAYPRADALPETLMNLLPPRTLLRWLRLRRFLYVLSRSWKMASTADRIVIFDQGFVTALCSMALLARSADRSIIMRGLALIPHPNLLIRLDAPRETLEARLRARLAHQGALERWFEFDLQTSLRQIEITAEVAHMLQKQGGRMIEVSSLDRRLLEKAVDRIVREAMSWHEKIDPAMEPLLRDGALSGVI